MEHIKYCHKCKAEIPVTAKYCSQCGMKQKKKHNLIKGMTICLIILSCILLFLFFSENAFLIIIIYGFVLWKIYESKYYKGKDFCKIKKCIHKYIDDCNELNIHIEELRNTYIGYDQTDFGRAEYKDNSLYNFKRKEFAKHNYSNNIYNCSRSVCDGARKQPFKYVCKYFNIRPEEESLIKFETLLNNYEAAEQGKIMLKNERKRILDSISNDIPFFIKKFGFKRLQRELGFTDIIINESYYPKYVFQYVSSGGNSSLKCEVVMNISELNRFIQYLSEIIKFRKSALGQRALMTSKLRRKIIERDNYTCRICGASIYKEPNLLLEVDHIRPIAKGGLTTESNLRTLCWKCNRKKGAKFEEDVSNTKGSEEIKAIPRSYNKYNISDSNTAKMLSTDENTFEQNETKNKQLACKEEIIMYDKEKGIYPSGQYLVGRDLPIGSYLLTARTGKIASVELFASYKKFKDCDSISYASFDDDYHVVLQEENTFLVIEGADIKKL